MESELFSRPVILLEANIDDMSPELLAPVLDQFLAEGAHDAWFTPIIMKRGRPAVVLSVLAPQDRQDFFVKEILTHTTTLGVRVASYERFELPRSEIVLESSLGPIRAKAAYIPGRALPRVKVESAEVVRLAHEHRLPIPEIHARIIALTDSSPSDESE